MKAYLFAETWEVRQAKEMESFLWNDGSIGLGETSGGVYHSQAVRDRDTIGSRIIEGRILGTAREPIRYFTTSIPRPKKKVKKWIALFRYNNALAICGSVIVPMLFATEEEARNHHGVVAVSSIEIEE